MENERSLSIIIPIYNAQKYLRRCLDSIVRQLNRETELILVDDGSTDQSALICDRYAKAYPEIRAYHQQNGGSSAARNAGLRMARGKWITFVDADDYVAEDFVKVILTYIDNGTDIILFEHAANEQQLGARNRKTGNERPVESFEESSRDLFVQSNFQARSVVRACNYNMRSVWAKVIRRTVLQENNIVFPLGVKIGEDMLFLLQVYSVLRRAKCVPKIIYRYFFRQEDSVTNRYKPDYEEIAAAYGKAALPWLDAHPEYVKYYMYYRLNDIILYSKFDFFHRDNPEDEDVKRKRFKRIMVDGEYREYYNKVKENGLLSQFTLDKRIILWLALHNCYSVLRSIFILKYR